MTNIISQKVILVIDEFIIDDDIRSYFAYFRMQVNEHNVSFKV